MAASSGAPKPSDPQYAPGVKLQFITSQNFKVFIIFLINFDSSW